MAPAATLKPPFLQITLFLSLLLLLVCGASFFLRDECPELASFYLIKQETLSTTVDLRTRDGCDSPEVGRVDDFTLLEQKARTSAFFRAKLVETLGYWELLERNATSGFYGGNISRTDFSVVAENLRSRKVITSSLLHFKIQDERLSSANPILGGAYFYISVEGTPLSGPATTIRLPHPLVVDHQNASYSVFFEVYDEDVNYEVKVFLEYPGYAGYLGHLEGKSAAEFCPGLPDHVPLDNFTFSTDWSEERGPVEPSIPKSSALGEATFAAQERGFRSLQPASLESNMLAGRSPELMPEPQLLPLERGRWLNDTWLRVTRQSPALTSESLGNCAAAKGPIHLILIGDSLMRGLYWGTREVLRGQKFGEYKVQHSDLGPAEDVPGFTLQYKWAPSAADVLERLQNGDFFYPNMSRTSVVFNTLLWDLRKPRNVHRYLDTSRQIFSALRKAQLEGRFEHVIWRSGAAVFPLDPPSNCEEKQCCDSNDFINGPRAELYNAAARYLAEEAGLEILDMWELTSGRPDLQKQNHWDRAYTKHGTVSNVVSSLLLEMLCD